MRATITILLCCLYCIFLSAQESAKDEDDVTVGLVLSGGGAKGLAHIGALKVLEEAGVRIDYIAGTSMGSIIGGFYAAGYSAEQLDSIFRVIDFGKLLPDNLPRSAETFYEKEAAERYAVTLPFEKFRITLPSSLSRGQNVYNLFVQLADHVSDVNDFEKLPIPFFCMATDIEKGEAVLLDKGYLPQAMSASMAIPSFFQPVELDGRLLVDGGAINNYPIDELKAKEVDIIIGVDVQDALKDREDLNSANQILQQISNLRTIEVMKAKVPKTDVYIRPDIYGYSMLSFERGDEIIQLGVDAAKRNRSMLDSIAALQKKKPDPRGVSIAQNINIKQLNTEGTEHYTRGYVKGKLRYRGSQSISYEDFKERISNLAATKNFKSIRYRLSNNGDGKDLTLNLKENSQSAFFRFGIHYDDLYKTGFLLNFTKKRLLFDNDVLSFDAVVFENVRFNLDYYIDHGVHWSVGLRARFNSFNKSITASFASRAFSINTDFNRIEFDVSDFTTQLYAQTQIRGQFALGLGGEYKHLTYELPTLSDPRNGGPLILDNSDYLSAYGFLKYDTLDNAFFPSSGLLFDGDFHLYLYSSDFTGEFSEFSVGKASMGFAVPLVHRLSLNVFAEGGFKVGTTTLSSFDFILGGYARNFINNFISFYGYDYFSFGGNSFVKGLLGLDYELFKNHHVNFFANYANAGNNIFNDGEWFTAPDFSGYSIGYGWDTFLGPVELKYTWSPEASQSIWFFNVGLWF